ncbi:MAG: hypothetical protein ACRC18_06560 [Cetobacterium sp.]
MGIKYVRLRKGMNINEVNELISNWLLLEDDIYLGNHYKHNWKCKCGNIIKDRTWDNMMHSPGSRACVHCRRIKTINRHRYEVEKDGEYEYIKSFFVGEIMTSGKIAKGAPYLQIKHKYCKSVYLVRSTGFINGRKRCTRCCGSYENSFAYHIEVELGKSLEKYWDFDKNTVNPYHTSKHMNKKVWIKCQEKKYHGSYEVYCNRFIPGSRCPRCQNFKVHPKDSFAQYHIDNTDKDFLEKYWDYEKNTVSPWEISPSNKNTIWIKCQNEEVNELNGLMKKDYHSSYEIRCYSFTGGNRCGLCHPSGVNPKVHPYDSFGYHNFDKTQSWHTDNDISPFRVAKNISGKYKFTCEECGRIFNKALTYISGGSWCPECSMSEGEKKIAEWLRYNGIEYEYEKEYDGLVGVGRRSLSYDFNLADYNMLIEFQGGQHEKYIPGFHESHSDFEKQQEHDRRKREYAKRNGVELLEIWYWDFDNIEEILNKELRVKFESKDYIEHKELMSLEDMAKL